MSKSKKHRIGIILILFFASLMPLSKATLSDEINFPVNVDEFHYSGSITYHISNEVEFIISEELLYNIENVNSKENSFIVTYSSTKKLVNAKGIDPICIEHRYEDGNTERFPFFENRDYTIKLSRKADLNNGKILEILTENVPDTLYFIYRYTDDSSEEQEYCLSRLSSIGYYPFPWLRVYDPLSYDPLTTKRINVPAGRFDCYSEVSGNWESLYDVDSGICIKYNLILQIEEGYVEDICVLSKLSFGRKWDAVNIELEIEDNRIDITDSPEINIKSSYDYDGSEFQGEVRLTSFDTDEVCLQTISVESITDDEFGVTNFTSNDLLCIWDQIVITEGGVSSESGTVGEPEVVWFKVIYDYEDEPFDSEKGRVYINGEEATWSSSNNRWELECVSDEADIIIYKVTEIIDRTYDLTTIDDKSDNVIIEWKKAGIPGYPFLSLFVGIGLIIILKKRI